MLITKLKLENFMTYSDATFEFTPGSNLILGRNGVGKSSIILAIGVALFNYNSIQLNKLIKYGETESKITVWFAHNNIDYKLTRVFGKTSLAQIEYGETVFFQINNVYAIIRELLGITPDIFRDSMCIRSSNLISFFTLEPSIRKKMFDALLGIEEYEQTWNSLRANQTELSKEANELTLKLRTKYTGIDRIEEDKKAEETIKHQLDLTRKYKSEILDKREELYKDQNDNRTALSSTIKKRDEILKEINSVNSLIKSYVEEMNLVSERIISLGAELESAKNNICPVCKQNITDSGIVSLYSEQIEELKNKIKNEELYFLNLKKIWLEKEIEELVVGEDNKRIDNELKEINQQLIDVEKRYVVLVDALKTKTNQIYAREQLKLQYDKDKINIDILNMKLDVINRVRDTMRQAVEYIRKDSIENINSEASIILSSLLNKNVDVVMNSDYDVNIHFNDKWLNFIQLSEGQKVMTALAIRLALLKYISNSGIVFLDEPSINLDQISKENLTQSLYDFGFNQLFLISHDDIFENKVDNIIKL